jgi:hypothetical protein
VEWWNALEENDKECNKMIVHLIFFQLAFVSASADDALVLTAQELNSELAGYGGPLFSIEEELSEGVHFVRGARQLRQTNIGHTHIDSMDVKCNDGGMEVTIEFAEPFGGVIYSKGHFNDQKCR